MSPVSAAAARLFDDANAGLVLTRAGRRVPVPSLPTHPLLAERSPTLAVARRHATAPGADATFLSPWSGTLLKVSVMDCRDGTDHFSTLVVVRQVGASSGLEMSEVRLLGALVEGWEDDRIRAVAGPAQPLDDALRLAGRFGLPSVEALVQHAARTGWYVPQRCGRDSAVVPRQRHTRAADGT